MKHRRHIIKKDGPIQTVSGYYFGGLCFLVLVAVVYGMLSVTSDGRGMFIADGEFYRKAMASPVTYVVFFAFVLVVVTTIVAMVHYRRLRLRRVEGITQTDEQDAYLGDVAKLLWRPINAIADRCAEILGEPEGDQVESLVTKVVDANEEVAAVVNDMVDFAMIASHRMEIVEEPYDLANAVREIVSMVEHDMVKRGLAFNVSCDPHIPAELVGDVTRIKQVVSCILLNAIKYTKEGSVTMRITMDPLFSGDIMLVISIKDTGAGMTRETMDRLFDSYKRYDEGKIRGTGLGMAIVKRLTDMMKGMVTVESALNMGTEFIIRIPQRVHNVAEVGEI